MTNINNNNLPNIETIYELKEEYKIPNFEDFMKSYEVDDNLNCDDLIYSDIGTPKGYGPVIDCGGGSSSSRDRSSRYEVSGYGAWKKGLTKEAKESLERERRIRSERRAKESTGEKITKGLMVGLATAALGPVGSIAVGTGLLMVGNNLSDEIAEVGLDTVTSGVSDGIINIAKDAVVKK